MPTYLSQNNFPFSLLGELLSQLPKNDEQNLPHLDLNSLPVTTRLKENKDKATADSSTSLSPQNAFLVNRAPIIKGNCLCGDVLPTAFFLTHEWYMRAPLEYRYKH